MVRFDPQVGPASRASSGLRVAPPPRGHPAFSGRPFHATAHPPSPALFLVRERVPPGDEYRPVVDASDATPTPDPFSDADALEELEEEIATLAAHIHAATHRLLTLIADFDRRRGWELGGHRSCAHWLSYRTGIDLGTAREKVRTARALTALPETGSSMARGELSFSQLRALSRVATRDNEADLLEIARGCTTAQLERLIRGFRRGSREDEAEAERRRHDSRALSVFPDEDGMYLIRGRLPAEVGALLMRAVEAAGDALYREESDRLRDRLRARAAGAAETGGGVRGPGEAGECREEGDAAADRLGLRDADSRRASAQRRADALGLLAERALAAGFGGAESTEEMPVFGEETGEGVGGENAGRPAQETGALPRPDSEAPSSHRHPTRGGSLTGTQPISASPAPISGTRAQRYQVVLHVEPDTLVAWGESGRSALEDGTRVSPETSRRLSCDCGLVRVRHAPDGSVLDSGQRTRTISPALRRALEARDQGCRFPGCGLRFTDAHHVKHWADGGETSLGNTLLLCHHHHRLVHEGGWRVDWWGRGRPVFFDPRGGTHFDGRWQPPGRRSGPKGGRSPGEVGKGEAPPPTGGDGAESLLHRNRLRGVRTDGRTAGARWAREADIPERVFFRAIGALGEGGEGGDGRRDMSGQAGQR